MDIFYIWVTTLTFLGHVTSSVTWPYDSTGAISYRCSIVTESSISNHFRGNGHFIYLCHDLDLYRSRDVIGHVTNRSAICHFLSVSHCNRTSISNRFRDIRPPQPVRTHRHTPQVILYSAPCNVLHWTDNYAIILLSIIVLSSPEAALSVASRLSVCLSVHPMPPIFSKQESRGNF